RPFFQFSPEILSTDLLVGQKPSTLQGELQVDPKVLGEIGLLKADTDPADFKVSVDPSGDKKGFMVHLTSPVGMKPGNYSGQIHLHGKGKWKQGITYSYRVTVKSGFVLDPAVLRLN